MVGDANAGLTAYPGRVNPTLGPLSPFFIVKDLRRAARFYVDRLGFDVRFQEPPDEPFFAIVGRGHAQLFLKEIGEGIEAQPNPTRHAWAPWDAYVETPDPDALAAELERRGATFHAPLSNRDDGLRGFEVRDEDGYVLFFGRPA